MILRKKSWRTGQSRPESKMQVKTRPSPRTFFRPGNFFCHRRAALRLVGGGSAGGSVAETGGLQTPGWQAVSTAQQHAHVSNVIINATCWSFDHDDSNLVSGDGQKMNVDIPSPRRPQGLFLAAALLRLALFYAFPGLPELVAGRVEVSTPVNSFKRCMLCPP